MSLDNAFNDVHVALAAGQQLLERFYADETMNFVALERKLREVMAASDAPFEQGESARALQTLQAVAALRPLEEIPHLALQHRLTVLHRELGNFVEQEQCRLRNLGLWVAIDATGDGLSRETAVEVPFVVIEYGWLSDSGLTPKQQTFEQLGSKCYDVFDVVDGQNLQGQRYFDVSRMWKLRGNAVGDAA